jgi:prepilin peptidase CpaA
MSLITGVIAVVTDLWRRKIPNNLTFPSIFLGLCFAFLIQGWTGLLSGLLGALVAMVCFGLPMALGWMGAGDVKLLMALGAWQGPRFCIQVAAFSLFYGALLTLVLLLVSGGLFGFFARFWRFARSHLIPGLEPVPFQVNRRLKMPFAIPMVLAVAAQIWGDPWGIGHWVFGGIWND